MTNRGAGGVNLISIQLKIELQEELFYVLSFSALFMEALVLVLGDSFFSLRFYLLLALTIRSGVFFFFFCLYSFL